MGGRVDETPEIVGPSYKSEFSSHFTELLIIIYMIFDFIRLKNFSVKNSCCVTKIMIK